MMPDYVTWARSIVVGAAIVIAALIPVVAGDKEWIPDNGALAHPVSAPKPTGNRRVCLALEGEPVTVLEKRYSEVYDDQNESGDTAVPMRGGVCWIKWTYPESKSVRGGFASKVRFYDDAE